MGFKCGIVGLPNVGKSTMFNSLTKAGIAAENYPFCTIDPNVGVVEVPYPRPQQLAAIGQPKKIVPTTMEFVDIAGLVSGASKGEGLGDQFLGHIRETDAIAQVVRCFEDEDVSHVHAAIEADIAELNVEEASGFLQEMGLDETGLNRVIHAGYKLLHLQTFFTAGPQEVRAWTIRVGDTAPRVAGRIHTDFEKSFIRAEVVAFDDFIANNGEQGAKDAGKWRLEGKDYAMHGGGVVHFRCNVRPEFARRRVTGRRSCYPVLFESIRSNTLVSLEIFPASCAWTARDAYNPPMNRCHRRLIFFSA